MGGLGGGVGAFVTCPLEVSKTRLQASKNKEWLTSAKKGSYRMGTGMFYTMRDIAKIEGVTGLWRGIGPMLVGVLPARASWFASYQFSKREIGSRNSLPDTQVHFISAVIAGLTVATITSPIFMVKTRMQLQSSAQQSSLKYKNSLDCTKRIFREEGFRGFYKGLTASYVGVSESSLQMVLYERFKYMTQKRLFETQSGQYEDIRNVKLGPVDQIAVGSIAKLIASAATYPHEVVRTRLREQRSGDIAKYRGVFQGIAVVAREEGLAGLYGGMAAHLFRVVPNAAIVFFVYESVMTFFERGPFK